MNGKIVIPKIDHQELFSTESQFSATSIILSLEFGILHGCKKKLSEHAKQPNDTSRPAKIIPRA